MTVGERIKRIRNFRGITQAELGEKIGLNAKYGARVGQYEINVRIPKTDLRNKIAEVLDVSPRNFDDYDTGSLDDMLFTLFWMEEAAPERFTLTELTPYPGERRKKDPEPGVHYHNGGEWPTKPPIAIWFKDHNFDDFLHEWYFHKKELQDGIITREEYFEWKLNWPASSDECGKVKPRKKWRKKKK